jgi:DinB superfamily
VDAVARVLRERVEWAGPRLSRLPEAEADHKPAPERWSKKEILGHLVDSACNNHQRFVRAILADELVFPGYEQEGWARCQQHADADWPLLVDLWSAYNRHLAALVARFPADKLATPCRIGGADAVTLAALAEDYLRHLDHHLNQLLGEVPGSE